MPRKKTVKRKPAKKVAKRKIKGKGVKQTAKKIAKYTGYGVAGFVGLQALMTGAQLAGLALEYRRRNVI